MSDLCCRTRVSDLCCRPRVDKDNKHKSSYPRSEQAGRRRSADSSLGPFQPLKVSRAIQAKIAQMAFSTLSSATDVFAARTIFSLMISATAKPKFSIMISAIAKPAAPKRPGPKRDDQLQRGARSYIAGVPPGPVLPLKAKSYEALVDSVDARSAQSSTSR